jgi:hypothetical protein
VASEEPNIFQIDFMPFSLPQRGKTNNLFGSAGAMRDSLIISLNILLLWSKKGFFKEVLINYLLFSYLKKI